MSVSNCRFTQVQISPDRWIDTKRKRPSHRSRFAVRCAPSSCSVSGAAWPIKRFCSQTLGFTYLRNCQSFLRKMAEPFEGNGAKISIAFVEDGGELHAFYD